MQERPIIYWALDQLKLTGCTSAVFGQLQADWILVSIPCMVLEQGLASQSTA